MSRAVEVWDRRSRRLARIAGDDQRYERANEALAQVWKASAQRPTRIRFRGRGVCNPTAPGAPPPAPRLLRRRGVALPLYLFAVFEAQCRLAPGARPGPNVRPLSTRDDEIGWSDFLAIDASYNARRGQYLVDDVKHHRTTRSRALEQVKGALRTLHAEDLVALETRGSRGAKDYAHFHLMHETGRGDLPTPRSYSVPEPGAEVIEIPYQFFLYGWLHVLQPSEIATWLALRYLRTRFPGSHDGSGVFLHGRIREDHFGLKRDSYEDGCAMLEQLGLITRVHEPAPVTTDESGDLFLAFDPSSMRYEPNRYQLTDDGLDADAMRTADKVVQLKLHEARQRAGLA